MSHTDPGREAILQGNQQRLEAYDRMRAMVDEVKTDNDRLQQQIDDLMEEKSRLKGTIAQQDTLIDDLQSREHALRIQNELYLQSRQTILTNLESAVGAIDGAHTALKHTLENALKNAKNAISYEISDSKRQEDLGNRTLSRLERVLTGGEDAEHVAHDAPPIVPEADQQQLPPQRLVPRQPMQATASNEHPRFRDGDDEFRQ